MEFQIKTVYNRADVEAFQHVVGGQIDKVRITVARGAMFILAALFAYVAVASFISGGVGTAIFSVLAAVICLYVGVKYVSFQANSVWRKWNKSNKDSQMVYSFGEEGVGESSSTVLSKYDNLYGCFETEAHYFLFMTKRECYILKKSDFVVGDPAQFRPFIARMMGKEVIDLQKKKR